MKRHSTVTTGIAAALLVAGLATTPAKAQTSPFEGVNQRFEAAAPQIGESLPDVSVYDLEGTELKIRDLVHGQYTVLVLGCLT